MSSSPDVQIKDDVETIASNMENRARRSEELKKKLDEDRKRFEDSERKRKHKEKRLFLWYKFISIFNPDIYANFIQRFEGLLFVIFVDTILVSILFSILYSLYIIIMADKDFDIISASFKIVGLILVSIICIVIQNHLPSNVKSGDKDDRTI